MEAQELGWIDGKCWWWCPTCGAKAREQKRGVAPALEHIEDCGKPAAESAPAVETSAPAALPEASAWAPKAEPALTEVSPGITVPAGSSEK